MNTNDIQVWKWLSHLIMTLGHHGMSSEKSAVENDIEHILCVKQMSWQWCIDRELEIIDAECLIDSNIFTHQGAKPVKRIHACDNPESHRDSLPGLPIALYDSVWITSLTQPQLDALNVSPDTYISMDVSSYYLNVCWPLVINQSDSNGDIYLSTQLDVNV